MFIFDRSRSYCWKHAPSELEVKFFSLAHGFFVKGSLNIRLYGFAEILENSFDCMGSRLLIIEYWVCWIICWVAYFDIPWLILMIMMSKEEFNQRS